MKRGTASTGVGFEFFEVSRGLLERYRGERLASFAATGEGTLSLHWSRGEQGVFSIRGIELTIQPSCVVVMRPDDRYELRKEPSADLRVIRLTLEVDAPPAHRVHQAASVLALSLDRLQHADAMEREEIIDRISSHLADQDGRTQVKDTLCIRAAHLAADVMRSDLGASHDLARLAGSVGLSINHLIRSFRAAHGVTPHAWLKEERLQRAKILLATQSVATVAHRVGWSSAATFSRTFANRFGAPPSHRVISDKPESWPPD